MIECGDAEESRRLAERICKRVRAEVVIDGDEVATLARRPRTQRGLLPV